MLDVDNPDSPSLIYDRDRQKSLITVLGKNIEAFKAGIAVGVFADRNRLIFFGHPAGNPFACLEVNFAEFCFVRNLGGHEHKVFFLLVKKINKNRVGAGRAGDNFNDLI